MENNSPPQKGANAMKTYTEKDCDCRSYGESQTCPFHGKERDTMTPACGHKKAFELFCPDCVSGRAAEGGK